MTPYDGLTSFERARYHWQVAFTAFRAAERELQMAESVYYREAMSGTNDEIQTALTDFRTGNRIRSTQAADQLPVTQPGADR